MLHLNFTPFPTLTTPRLVLRELQDNDLHRLFDLRTDERVNRYLNRPLPESLSDIQKFIANVHQITRYNEGLYWVLTLKNEDQLLGAIGLRNFSLEQYQAELGYELHPDHQGEGFMHEAIGHVLAFGFSQLGLKEIKAETHPGNLRSIQLLKKHGFVKVNVSENTYLLNEGSL